MRQKHVDRKNALSLLDEAEREMDFTLRLPVTEESAFLVVRNVHECFRMLGDARLATMGYEATDHTEAINSLLALNVDARRSLQVIDSLRRLRNRVNYYGYRPSVAEAKDAADIADACFKPLLDFVRKEASK